ASCSTAAKAAASDGRIVGTTCAAGALARVPGGASCSSSSGDLDPQTFTCGALDDLAIAMSGNVPSSTVVTRFAGIVPRGAFGEDLAITFDATGVEHPVAVRAGYYDVCK